MKLKADNGDYQGYVNLVDEHGEVFIKNIYRPMAERIAIVFNFCAETDSSMLNGTLEEERTYADNAIETLTKRIGKLASAIDTMQMNYKQTGDPYDDTWRP